MCVQYIIAINKQNMKTCYFITILAAYYFSIYFILGLLYPTFPLKTNRYMDG